MMCEFNLKKRNKHVTLSHTLGTMKCMNSQKI